MKGWWQKGGSSQQPLWLSQPAEPLLAWLYLPSQAVAVPWAAQCHCLVLWEKLLFHSAGACVCQGSAAEMSWAGQVSCVLQVPSWSKSCWSQAGSVPCQSLCEGSWWHLQECLWSEGVGKPCHKKNRNAYLVLPFFFFSRCSQTTSENLWVGLHRPVHPLFSWFAATVVLRALFEKVFFRRDECTCHISITERLC